MFICVMVIIWRGLLFIPEQYLEILDQILWLNELNRIIVFFVTCLF
jgi:hypothetical protein